jgi:prepilin-type N-terminal cleavage/methylation domain-containing protein
MSILNLRTLEKMNHAGFTLVEVMVAAGVLSLIVLAAVQVQLMSIRSAQSTAASDELNSEISALVNLVNEIKQTPGLPNLNGCTNAFLGMPISPGNKLPIVSPSQKLLPPPTSLNLYKNYIKKPTVSPIAIYQNRAASTNPIIQVTAPAISNANAKFPAPPNNLWITNLYFKAWINKGSIPPPQSNPAWVSNLYLLHVDAQKTGLGSLSGGPTVYQKEILVTLWTDPTNTVVYCGGNPI